MSGIKTMRYARLALLTLLFGHPIAVEATDFYVSPPGKGTACTKARPCGLIDVVGVVRAAAANQRDDIRVNLLDGLYLLERPIELTVADSGRNGKRIIWQAAAGAKPTLSGGIPLGQWSLFDQARNIWRADAPPANA